MMIDFLQQKYHRFGHKYSLTTEICSLTPKNMTDSLIFDKQ